ncbi:Non-histone chromosomal protein 6 [Borealophlyctis nickersoniae]|nr:Non-histone chromosomal protein 6 [Borealophlyctis nickersoniae]
MAKEGKSRSAAVSRKAGGPASDSKRKTRAKKDPNAPKKPLSGFIIFSNENRQRIKEENPSAEFRDMGRLLGAAWKELSDAEKEVYNKKKEEDKKRYEREVAAYQKSGGAAAASEEEEEDEGSE